MPAVTGFIDIKVAIDTVDLEPLVRTMKTQNFEFLRAPTVGQVVFGTGYTGPILNQAASAPNTEAMTTKNLRKNRELVTLINDVVQMAPPTSLEAEDSV